MSIAPAEAALAITPLRVVRGGSVVDVAAAEQAVSDLLLALGQDLNDEHTREL